MLTGAVINESAVAIVYLLAEVMLSVWALSHTEVRGEHSLQRSIGGGGVWQMTKAQEKSGPRILGCTCRGDHILIRHGTKSIFHCVLWL